MTENPEDSRDKPQQDAGCEGGIPNGMNNYIVVTREKDFEDVFDETDNDEVYFRGEVSTDMPFTPIAENGGEDKFKAETRFYIWNSKADFEAEADPFQTIMYHTSCSQRMECDAGRMGDQICSVSLIEFYGEDQPPELDECLEWP